MFIVFEGIDGSGKSTLARGLCAELQAAGKDPLLLREPGSTALGEALRQILLSKEGGDLDPWAEACLFTAARAELLARCVRPALAAGRTVLLDRFAYSTLAYQGYGSLLDLGRLFALQRAALGDLWPDRVFWLDLPPIKAAERRGASDRIEARDEGFHLRVAAGYAALAAAEPQRFHRLDAEASPEALLQAALNALPERA